MHQAGDEGELKELEQAPAPPPELLIDLENIAGEMILADAWDAVAVCVALSLAWSLMRLVHVNRSRITHYSEDSLWCRAFRGKTRKDGARRPFRWVLIRKGPAGVDIGGHILQKWTQYSRRPVSHWSTSAWTHPLGLCCSTAAFWRSSSES